MSFLLRILIVGLSSFYYTDILVWWYIIIIPFIIGLVVKENYISLFLNGFIGVSVAWLYIILEINSSTESIISTKILDIINIDSINKLIIYTIIIGGFLGGISSITGKALKEILFKKKKKNYKFNL